MFSYHKMLCFMRLSFPSQLFHKLSNLLTFFVFFPDRVLPCHIPKVIPLSYFVGLNDNSTTTMIAPSSQNLESSWPSRVIKLPSYLKDFRCYSVSHNNVPIAHPLSHVHSYDLLSSNHKAFICSIFSHSEPTTYSQVAKVPKWNEAMIVDLKALESNGAWTLTTLLAGKCPVGCKWVYHIKYRSDGSLKHYKAHLVAQGYTQ